MSFRLAIVGHSSPIADIRQIVSESFDNVETQGIELSNDEITDSAVALLRTMLPQLDGVLYTRNDPYKLVVSRLDHADVVSGYADIDATSLVQCLLIASYRMQADICRISVDTLDYDTVMRTYDALGIGSGSSMRTALINAELGTQRAWAEGCNRACLVNGEDQIIGPIEPNELYNIHQTLFDRNLTKAAEDCGLSINTIFRIDTFVRRKNNGSFMTAELRDELHISFRTAARIVEKLEDSGYIVEIGRSVVNGRGRPTRLFKLLW